MNTLLLRMNERKGKDKKYWSIVKKITCQAGKMKVKCKTKL